MLTFVRNVHVFRIRHVCNNCSASIKNVCIVSFWLTQYYYIIISVEEFVFYLATCINGRQIICIFRIRIYQNYVHCL